MSQANNRYIHETNLMLFETIQNKNRLVISLQLYIDGKFQLQNYCVSYILQANKSCYTDLENKNFHLIQITFDYFMLFVLNFIETNETAPTHLRW